MVLGRQGARGLFRGGADQDLAGVASGEMWAAGIDAF
jgi:hypothetical protein